MSIYYPGCQDSISDPVCSDCPVSEGANIRSIFFVKKSYTFSDITDASEWGQAVTDGNVYVFPYINGSLTQTPTERPGFGDMEVTLEGYEYAIECMEPNYQANWAFWDSIKNSKNFKAGWRTESYVHLSDDAAQITPTQPVSDDKKAAVYWNISIKFSQDSLARPYDKPTNVFERCIDVL